MTEVGRNGGAKGGRVPFKSRIGILGTRSVIWVEAGRERRVREPTGKEGREVGVMYAPAWEH